MSENTKHTTENRQAAVRHRALELGFDVCGFASAALPIDTTEKLQHWLAKGYHADMHWIERTAEVRADVHKKLPGARSVVVLARNYYHPRPDTPPDTGRVARYAWGRDYHKTLKGPLKELARFLDNIEPGARSYASVDYAPVMERSWAERAGVAAIGKNSLALRRDLGSYFFLATVLTTVELDPDPPRPDLCGTCTLCIDACPTNAIVEPRVVDSNRCIAYHTIENRGDIPDAVQENMGDWVFGCDICQEVCPWNRFATPTDEPDFAPRPGQAQPELDWLIAARETAFNQRFEGTPLRRAKWTGMKRNAAIAKRNAQHDAPQS